MAHTVDEIVNGYLTYLESKADEYFWAWIEANERCKNLKEGTEVSMKLIEAAPSKWARDCIAAHILEDLVNQNGIDAIIEVKRIVKSSESLRSVLHVINVDKDSPAFVEWEKLLELYPKD